MFEKMAGIIVISHGSFASGIMESAQMIVGQIPKSAVLCFFEGDNTDEFGNKLREKILEFGAGTIVLVDLFGGTPFNQLVSKCYDLEFTAVSGVNLPMLLEVTGLRDEHSGAQLAEKIAEAGKEGVIDIAEFLKNLDNTNDPDPLDELEDLV